MTPSSCGYLYGEAVKCGLADRADVGKACMRQIESTTTSGSDARIDATLELQNAQGLAERAVHSTRPCHDVASSTRALLGYETYPANSPSASASGDMTAQMLLGLVTIVVLIAIYLVPIGVAYWRDARRFTAIAATNLLLGWTIIGWIGALIWAMGADKE